MNRFSPANLSLRYVLLLALLLGLLVPSWLAFEFEKTEVQQRLYKDLADDRDRYADLLSVSLREPLWQLAPLFAEPLVDKIMADPKISRIVVKRLPEGQLFLERGKDTPSAVPVAQREVVVQGKIMGTVTVHVTEKGITAATLAAQQRFLWRTASIGAAAMLFIFLALHWRLTRPIEMLVSQSESLANGHLNETATWHRDDELGRLGRSLEDTRRALAKLLGELNMVNSDLRTENTQRKNAEAKIAKHAEELEIRVAERTRELSSANHTLSTTLDDLRQTQSELIESQKLASLGRMVAGVAHELNTPLGNALTIGTAMGQQVRNLQTMTQTGQLRKSTLSDFLSNAIEASEVLERSLARSAALVTKFKQVAESESTETLCDFDLSDLTGRLCANFSASHEGAPIALVTRVPPGILMTGYPELLSQVLGNLLNNAQIHAFDTLTEAQIVVQATVRQYQVEITVSDNGTGVAPEFQDRIFDPMFTTRMGRGGIGLGLSVAHNIVTRHLGGKIQVRDAEPKGACFVLTLPMVVSPGSQKPLA